MSMSTARVPTTKRPATRQNSNEVRPASEKRLGELVYVGAVGGLLHQNLLYRTVRKADEVQTALRGTDANT